MNSTGWKVFYWTYIKTRLNSDPGEPVLKIRGTAIFGGIEVKG